MRPSVCPTSQHFVDAQYRSVIPEIEPPAAAGPRPVARVLDQASFHGIVVHVIQFFISLLRAPDVHVVEPPFTIRDSQFIIRGWESWQRRVEGFSRAGIVFGPIPTPMASPVFSDQGFLAVMSARMTSMKFRADSRASSAS